MLEELFVESVNKTVCRTLLIWVQTPVCLVGGPGTEDAIAHRSSKKNIPRRSTGLRTSQEAFGSREKTVDGKLVGNESRTMNSRPIQCPLVDTIVQHQATNLRYRQPRTQAMSFAAMKSCEFNLEGSTSIDSTPFGLVCLSDNQKHSQFQQIKKFYFAALQRSSRPTKGNFLIGRTDKQRQAVYSPADDHGINKVGAAEVDGAATVETRR